MIDAASRFEQQFPPAVSNTVNYLDPFLEDKAMLAPKSRNSCGPVTCHSCCKIGHLKKHCRTMNSGSSQLRSGLDPKPKAKLTTVFIVIVFLTLANVCLTRKLVSSIGYTVVLFVIKVVVFLLNIAAVRKHN